MSAGMVILLLVLTRDEIPFLNGKKINKSVNVSRSRFNSKESYFGPHAKN